MYPEQNLCKGNKINVVLGTSRIRSPTLSDDIVPTLSLILTLSVENIDYRLLECD